MLSVLIAVESEEEGLARTLAALVPAVVDGAVRDCLVIDSGGMPEIARIADVAGCAHVTGPLAETLQPAVDRLHCAWVLVLSPGTVLEDGWFREAAEFVERAGSSGQADRMCAAFSFASQRYGAVARIKEAWRFVSANLWGGVAPDQGLVLPVQVLRDRAARSSVWPPRPPRRSRKVVLRARAFAP